jgi:uncharacterized repeat protein (TIGR03803 family)
MGRFVVSGFARLSTAALFGFSLAGCVTSVGTPVAGGSGRGQGMLFEQHAPRRAYASASPFTKIQFNFSTLYSFSQQHGGQIIHPYAGLFEDSAGNLYAVASGKQPKSFGAVIAFSPPKYQKPVTLYTFKGNPDGESPKGTLVAGAGVLYGTSAAGGGGGCGKTGCGTVYSLTPQGGGPYKEAIECTFSGSSGSNPGAKPYAGLSAEDDGSFYGMTSAGGAANLGTVFRFTPSKGCTSLYSFKSGKGGATPDDSPIVVNGTLYGTTSGGGQNGLGTVFSLPVSGGTPNILYSFGANSTDGATPRGALLYYNDVLYGTTSQGGQYGASGGFGTVYQINTDGAGYTTLYEFGQTSDDGYDSWSSLVTDSSGNLYGTTLAGGSGSCVAGKLVGCGTVFELTPYSGTYYESIIATLTGPGGETGGQDFDGGGPFSGVIVDPSTQAIFGATFNGSKLSNTCQKDGCGIVFEGTPQ